MPPPVQVAPGVHVATSATWSTTSTVVDAADGSCLLVDPALTPAELVDLARCLASTGREVRCAWATHAHWDHVLWHPELPDVPRWATATAATVAAASRDRLAAEADDVAPGHDHTLLGRLMPLGAGGTVVLGRAVTVLETDGHHPGHGSLLLPGHRALLAGDMLSAREIPLLDLDGARDPVERYRASLTALAEVLHTVDVVVPGHGPVLERSAALAVVARDRAYLDSLGDGREPDDDRLVDPWLRAQHEDQREALGRRRTREGRH